MAGPDFWPEAHKYPFLRMRSENMSKSLLMDYSTYYQNFVPLQEIVVSEHDGDGSL